MHTPPAAAATDPNRERRRFAPKGVDAATCEAARTRLEQQGHSIAEWARANDFSESLVHEVLSGRRPCVRGESWRIAVALGMKQAPAAKTASAG